MRKSTHKIAIIGAGLVGSMIAIILAKKGYSVDLFEKRMDVRKINIHQNRTIAMSISYRGIKALERIGLKDYVMKSTIPKYSRMVHNGNGSKISQYYGLENHSINTINRRELNSILINKFEEYSNSKVYFEHSLEDYQPNTNSIVVKSKKSSKLIKREFDYIIGADGVFSQLRRILEKDQIIRVEHVDVEYGYRELSIPPNNDGSYKLINDHVWPRGKSVLVALPIHGGGFSCNIFLPAYGKDSLESLTSPDQVSSFFKTNYSEFTSLNQKFISNYLESSNSKIYSVKCDKWNNGNKSLLLGDAAHAIVPFLAMGMNMGFEDCTIFDDMLTKFEDDLAKVFVNFSNIRKTLTLLPIYLIKTLMS